MIETSLSIMTFFEWGLLCYSYFHQKEHEDVRAQGENRLGKTGHFEREKMLHFR